MINNLNRNGVLSAFVVVCLVISFTLIPFSSIDVIAAENIENEIEIGITEENVRLLSDEELLDAGFSLEDLEGKNVYEVERQIYPNGIPSVLYSGDVAYEEVTAYNSFTGAGHTAYGNNLKIGVGISSGTAQLIVGLYSYNSLWSGGGIYYNSNFNGNVWQSDWISIYSGDTFYFKYWIVTSQSQTLPLTFTVLMAVA